MYVNMVTRLLYKKKEVSTPPNKMKHISPLQRNVFLPLTCRIFKNKSHILHNFSPFLSWLTKGIRSYKALPEKHKDDQGGTKDLYKCMNVMKQDTMNDKIKERCKTCEKQCMQEDLNRSRGVKMLSSQPQWIEKLSRGKEISQSIHLAIEEVLRLR